MNAEKILLGKVISSRVFCRYALTEVIRRVRKLQPQVQIDGIAENVFKFTFKEKKDKERIFRSRPWSFDGDHLILKEWKINLAIYEVAFDMTPFFIQIHNLPPTLLNLGNARKIGNQIGFVPDETVSRQSVVASKFSRFRVEITVENPLPLGFFQKKENGEESWIQFKYERLSDFCYGCGRLNHVYVRCTFSKPATIQTNNGVVAKIYRAWMRAEVEGSLVFVQLPARSHGWPENSNGLYIGVGSQTMEETVESVEDSLSCVTLDGQDEGQLLNDWVSLPQRANAADDPSMTPKDDSRERFLNALEVIPQLQALSLTLNRQPWVSESDFQKVVVSLIRDPKWDASHLTSWASEFLNGLALAKAQQRNGLKGQLNDLKDVILDWLGIGPRRILPPKGRIVKLVMGSPTTSVRPPRK